jgi:acyl carrier protein
LKGGTVSKEQLIDGIKKAIQELIPVKWLSSLNEETHLRDLGIDSVEMVRLVTNLEQVFHISFSANELAPENFRDIASLLKLLRTKNAMESSGDPLLSS